jgi:hypothetical protein
VLLATVVYVLWIRAGINHSWQRDRNARAHGRLERVVSSLLFLVSGLLLRDEGEPSSV